MITITIEAQSPEDCHKCTVVPSVAVNPPAVQYFKGVTKDFFSNKIVDNREKQISGFVVQMLSSEDYPNPQICSKTKAKAIARFIPKLLDNLQHSQKTIISTQ